MIARTPRLLLVATLVAAAPAHALSFLEDFESYIVTGFEPDENPDQDWYDYSETEDVGNLGAGGKALAGEIWMVFEAGEGTASDRRADFELAAPAQLTNLTFTIGGTTITDDGVGSRQFVAIQSGPPRRTMVEFYVFCKDDTNPSGCELRVRFENVDSTGQVLINATVGLSVFTINIFPDWSTGTYNLWVNGVDDGDFPFLELPNNIGNIRISQYNNFDNLALTFDDLAIDGGAEAAESIGKDAVNGLKEFAHDMHFRTPGSLFLLGVIAFITISAAVALPVVFLGRDNTVLPALAFVVTLAVLWLVLIEWWPPWIGIALIIAVSAVLGLAVRQWIIGMRDASNSAGLVAGSLGYFIIATALLGFSGYATESVEVPNNVLSVPEDDDDLAEKQTLTGAVTECLVTFFSDCSRTSVSETWGKIVDVATTVFNFARTAFKFLFQLLSFQLPIPTLFNVIIILPPASVLATVGFQFITRSS